MRVIRHSTQFLGLEETFSSYDGSRAVVLCAPCERTTSYGKGTAKGPEAILRASQFVELWDEELSMEPFRQGICTLTPLDFSTNRDISECLLGLEQAVEQHLQNDKFVLTLGGEHSVSIAPVRAAKRIFGNLGVVQFDAHADLRQSYEGSIHSHAAVMRRIVETEVSTLAIGIRAVDREEVEFIDRQGLPVVWGHEVSDLSPERFARLLSRLPDEVYLTFDVDYLDPSLLPSTGTPEPGGGGWYDTLRLLRILFRDKHVVGMDLVELAPHDDLVASDFTTARLAYKALGLACLR